MPFGAGSSGRMDMRDIAADMRSQNVQSRAAAEAAARQARLGGGGGGMFNPGMAGIDTMNNLGSIVGNQWNQARDRGGVGSGLGVAQAGNQLNNATAIQLEAMRQSNQNQRINALLPAILAMFSRAQQTPQQLSQFLGQGQPQAQAPQQPQMAAPMPSPFGHQRIN